MVNLAVIIYLISTVDFGNWWWLFAPCIAYDLIYIGIKVGKS